MVPTPFFWNAAPPPKLLSRTHTIPPAKQATGRSAGMALSQDIISLRISYGWVKTVKATRLCDGFHFHFLVTHNPTTLVQCWTLYYAMLTSWILTSCRTRVKMGSNVEPLVFEKTRGSTFADHAYASLKEYWAQYLAWCRHPFEIWITRSE